MITDYWLPHLFLFYELYSIFSYLIFKSSRYLVFFFAWSISFYLNTNCFSHGLKEPNLQQLQHQFKKNPVISNLSHSNIDELSPSTSKQFNVSNLNRDNDIFDHNYRNGRHYISCIPCSKHPNINKVYSKILPAIAQISGTIYREDIKKKAFDIRWLHIMC